MESLVFTTRNTPEIAYKSGNDEYTFVASQQMFRPSIWKKNGVKLSNVKEIEMAEIARANYAFSNSVPINFVAHAKDGDDTFFWNKEILFHNDASGFWRLAFVGDMGSVSTVDPPFLEEVKTYLDKKKEDLFRRTYLKK